MNTAFIIQREMIQIYVAGCEYRKKRIVFMRGYNEDRIDNVFAFKSFSEIL